MNEEKAILFSREQLFCLSQMFKQSFLTQSSNTKRDIKKVSDECTKEIRNVRELFLQFHMEKLFFLEVFEEFRKEISKSVRAFNRSNVQINRQIRILKRVGRAN